MFCDNDTKHPEWENEPERPALVSIGVAVLFVAAVVLDLAFGSPVHNW
jgi:hypothetical protein